MHGKSMLNEWQYFLRLYLAEIGRCEIFEIFGTMRGLWLTGFFSIRKYLSDGCFCFFTKAGKVLSIESKKGSVGQQKNVSSASSRILGKTRDVLLG